MSDDLVLITGITGYIASHCARQALNAGFKVRGTARNAEKAAKVLGELNADIDYVSADLMQQDGWADAMQGVRYVLHVASPFPDKPPAHEDDLIVPARTGAEHVLRAAKQAGADRVVLTSSMAAISSGYGKAAHERTFSHKDWSNLAGEIGAYEKSKTIAEQAAWELARDIDLDLAVINPGLVLGPLVADNAGTSLEAVRRILTGEMPGLPKLGFGMVDVRDVAAAHISAMTAPEAVGNRYPCVADYCWMHEMAAIAKEALGARGTKIPTRRIPNFAVKIAAMFDPTLKLASKGLGVRHLVDTSTTQRDLDWTPMSPQQTLVDTAEDLIARGIVQL
ncbi:MAG: SDR family NAD(P)-dependent oxidoreductase [Alphaproteobacteria bacterium]